MNDELITAEDYYSLKKAVDIQVSEKHVAWVEKLPDKNNKTYKSNIFVLNKSNGSIRQYTNSDKDSHPRFSPEGNRIAFLSSRSDKSQIYMIELDGGEATALTAIKSGVVGFAWSPDGEKIAFSSKIKFDEDLDKKELSNLDMKIEKLREEDENVREKDPRVINNFIYRSGTSYLSENKFSQIFIVNIDDKGVKQLSTGEYQYSIPRWLDDNNVISTAKREQPLFTSDTAQVIKFNIDKQGLGDVLVSFNATYFPQAPETAFGKIYQAYNYDIGKPGQNTIWGLIEGSELKPINLDLDRSVSSIKILEDKLICLVEDTGKADLRLYNNGNFETLIRPDASILEFDGELDDIYFIGTDPKHPSAVYRLKNSEISLIKDVNGEFLSKKRITEPEEFWLTNPEGVKFQGWFFDAGMQNGKKPGLILSIHGGPHVMWTNAGSMWHEWQMSISRGYSVLAVNPIGSQGYGQQFSQVITARWGIDDARDLLQSVDHFIDRVDADRLYTTGGSYAGFQVANLIARDQRFKAACAQRGVYNLISFWSTTDIPFFGFWEMGGKTPWTDLQLFWDISPVSRAENINTPLLLIHSENDFRVSIGQAEELFASLKKDDKEVTFVRYPRDGHELSRSGEPEHVVDRLNRMLDFFDSHN